MIQAGHIKPEERLFQFTDVETGQTVKIHGSIYYNPFRKRWVSIRNEVGGTSSYLGEIWYCEADHYLGPWVYARKIVTHDNYSFYNICQHPLFAKEGGRKIFFEGTYTYTFTHPTNPKPTPRYDYNQMMYMVELDDHRLFLPVPVYNCEGGAPKYCTLNDIPSETTKKERVFFAPDRPRMGTIPINERRDTRTGAPILTAIPYDVSTGKPSRVAFYALPANCPDRPAKTTSLYEYIHNETGERLYLTKGHLADPRLHAHPRADLPRLGEPPRLRSGIDPWSKKTFTKDEPLSPFSLSPCGRGAGVRGIWRESILANAIDPATAQRIDALILSILSIMSASH